MPVPAHNRWLHVAEAVQYVIMLQIHSLLTLAEDYLVGCDHATAANAPDPQEEARDDVEEDLASSESGLLLHRSCMLVCEKGCLGLGAADTNRLRLQMSSSLDSRNSSCFCCLGTARLSIPLC